MKFKKFISNWSLIIGLSATVTTATVITAKQTACDTKRVAIHYWQTSGHIVAKVKVNHKQVTQNVDRCTGSFRKGPEVVSRESRRLFCSIKKA